MAVERVILEEIRAYRDAVIQAAMLKYGGTYAYWDKAWDDRARYFVTMDGVVYEEHGGPFLGPPWWRTDTLKRVLRQDHSIAEDNAPIICKCGNDRLQVFTSDSYETSARCPQCSATAVVHSG
jgi:hypothetical protein